MAIEPLYITDTHVLLWRLTDDPKLSIRAGEIFDAAERGETRIVVSAIVLAELYHLTLKRKGLPDFAEIYRRLDRNPDYRLASFHPSDVLEFQQDASITELHDRIIAELARRLDAPILTVDPIITASHVARVEW